MKNEGDNETSGTEHAPQFVFGRAEYKFEEAPTLTNLPPRDQLTKEAKDIIEAYEQILLQRSAIRQSLDAFATNVGRPESAELTACFRALREAAGVDAEIHLIWSEAEPLKIEIDDTGWSNLHIERHRYQNAIKEINSALSNGFILLQKKEAIITDIRDKLGELQSGRWNQRSYQLYATLKDIPEWIEMLSDEVERLLKGIHAAEPYLGCSPLLHRQKLHRGSDTGPVTVV